MKRFLIVFLLSFAALAMARALIFGFFASTLFTLVVIPVTYFAVYNTQQRGAS